MRQLPAQFTDIATQLAGGSSPLLVLMQQGGQIKDSFGGIGNALTALASIVTPARLAFAGLVGIVAAGAVAYKNGSAEVDEYRRALVLTGNAAGATVTQLNATAEAACSTTAMRRFPTKSKVVPCGRMSKVLNCMAAYTERRALSSRVRNSMMTRVTTMEVNIDARRPMIRVTANPRTGPEP